MWRKNLQHVYGNRNLKWLLFTNFQKDEAQNLTDSSHSSSALSYKGRVAIQDRSRLVAWAASVIGWEARSVLILATGLGFAARPSFTKITRTYA